MKCITLDCTNDARKDRKTGLCWRCTKQKTRKGDVVGPLRDSYGNQWDTLMAAVEAWAENPSGLDGDRAFLRRSKGGRSPAEERIAKAAIRYAESLGYEKPTPKS